MAERGSDKKFVREAVGVFAGGSAVQAAIEELIGAGFDRTALGLLASEYAVRETLGDFYARTNEQADDSEAPNTAFVARKSIGDTVHAYLGSLFFAGTTVASGAVVASLAVLGGSLVAAAAGAAAVGAMAGALALIIRQSDAEHLEEQIDEGHLLLFVRTLDPEHESRAIEILSKHTPIEVEVVTAPAQSTAAA